MTGASGWGFRPEVPRPGADGAGAAQRPGPAASGPPSLDTERSNSHSEDGRPPTWCINPLGWLRLRCGHGSEKLVPARCRSCPGCQLAHKLKIRRRVEHGVAQGGATAAFLTVTGGLVMTWPELMRAWGRFRGAVVRKYGKFEYVAVKEEGAGGSKHLHVLTIGWSYVNQRVLSALWKKATRGLMYVVDIRRVSGADKAARYVTKYVTKALTGLDLRKMVTYSAGWPQAPDAGAEGDWRFVTTEGEGPDLPRGAARAEVVRGPGYVVLNRGCDCVADATAQTYSHALYGLRLQHLGRYGPVRGRTGTSESGLG